MIQLKGKKKDQISKRAFYTLLLVAVFSVGTFIGKQFTDNQNKLAGLANCKAPSVTDSLADTSGKFSGEKMTAVQTQTARAAQAGQTVGSQTAQAGQTTQTPEDSAATRAPSSTDDETSTYYDDPSMNSEPAAKAKPASEADEGEADTKLPDGIATAKELLGRYTIQVASVPSDQEAADQVAEFKSKGLNAFFMQKKVPGVGTRFRVNIGLFSDADSAREYRRHLQDQKIVSEEVIVQKIKDKSL